MTLDAVATAGREYGATWGTASVRNIEAGKVAPTLPTLIHLALALGSLTGEDLRLADVLGDADLLDLAVQGDDHRPVSRAWLNAVLAGGPVRLAPRRYESPGPFSDPDQEPKGPPASLAVKRAAQKVGIAPTEFLDWADRLWGRSLEDEAARRAGPESTPQARGLVTRRLVDAVRWAIEDREIELEDQRDLHDSLDAERLADALETRRDEQ